MLPPRLIVIKVTLHKGLEIIQGVTKALQIIIMMKVGPSFTEAKYIAITVKAGGTCVMSFSMQESDTSHL